MPCCAVVTCKNSNKNTKGTDIKFYRFPKNSDLAKQWIAFCMRNDTINIKNATICSEHFEKNAVSLKHRLLQPCYSTKRFRNLKHDAVPTIKLPRCKREKNSEETINRLANGNQRFEVDNILNQSTTELVVPAFETECVFIKQEPEEDSTCNSSTNRDTQYCLINQQEVFELREKIKHLETQNRELLKKLEDKEIKNKKYEQALANVFSPAQMQKIMNAEKNTWVLTQCLPKSFLIYKGQ